MATKHLTRKQVAELFGVSLATVTRWAKEGLVPSAMTPGGQHRYPRAQVENLARDLQQGPPGQPRRRLSRRTTPQELSGTRGGEP